MRGPSLAIDFVTRRKLILLVTFAGRQIAGLHVRSGWGFQNGNTELQTREKTGAGEWCVLYGSHMQCYLEGKLQSMDNSEDNREGCGKNPQATDFVSREKRGTTLLARERS